jgi:hypothetical protein
MCQTDRNQLPVPGWRRPHLTVDVYRWSVSQLRIPLTASRRTVYGTSYHTAAFKANAAGGQ